MSYIKYIFLILIIGVSFHGVSSAQQLMQQSQFLYNTNAINPAYASTNEQINFALSNRMQWIGLEGAPVTQTFTFGMPIAKDKLNVGLFVSNESIGARGLTSLHGNLSYHLRLREGYLSFGMRGGIMNWRINRDKLEYYNSSDPSSLVTAPNSMVVNFDAGLVFAYKGFISGISVFNLTEPVFFNTGSGEMNQLVKHYFAYAGYRFKLNDQLHLRTTALLKYISNAPMNIEGNVALIIKNKFHVAATYRSSGMIALMLQVYLNNNIYFGYAYDYTINNLKSYAPIGTHEIFVGYNLSRKTKPMVTPRFL